MPRSVNHVASRAKRKRILKLTRGYYGARKNVWTVAVLVSFEELARIFVAVGIFDDSVSGTFTFHVVTLVDISVLEFVDALSVLYVVFLLSGIDIAVGIHCHESWIHTCSVDVFDGGITLHV